MMYPGHAAGSNHGLLRDKRQCALFIAQATLSWASNKIESLMNILHLSLLAPCKAKSLVLALHLVPIPILASFPFPLLGTQSQALRAVTACDGFLLGSPMFSEGTGTGTEPQVTVSRGMVLRSQRRPCPVLFCSSRSRPHWPSWTCFRVFH